MKKIFVLIFTVCILVSVLAACSEGEEYATPTEPDGTSPNVETSAPTNATNSEEPEGNGKILVDNEYITATYEGASDMSSVGVFIVTIMVENKTDADIVITLEDADVDGETIPLIGSGVPLVVRPGNKGRNGFTFSMVNLSISSMDDAEKATFRVVVRDNDTYSVVNESELVTIDLHGDK